MILRIHGLLVCLIYLTLSKNIQKTFKIDGNFSPVVIEGIMKMLN